MKKIALLAAPLLALPLIPLSHSDAATVDTGHLTICYSGLAKHAKAQTWEAEEYLNSRKGIGGGTNIYHQIKNGCQTWFKVSEPTRFTYWVGPKGYKVTAVGTKQTAGTGAKVTFDENFQEFHATVGTQDNVTVMMHFQKSRNSTTMHR